MKVLGSIASENLIVTLDEIDVGDRKVQSVGIRRPFDLDGRIEFVCLNVKELPNLIRLLQRIQRDVNGDETNECSTGYVSIENGVCGECGREEPVFCIRHAGCSHVTQLCFGHASEKMKVFWTLTPEGERK